MTVFFTSDQHFFHANILSYCPNRIFANIEEMNSGLIVNHNSVVKTDDEVYHVGDFSFREDQIESILSQLNGTHYLISGNHDKTFIKKDKSGAATRRYIGYGFKKIYNELYLNPFLINHFPYGATDSGHEARYMEYRPKDKGSWLLCGHTHSTTAVNGRMINVGVDAWDCKPVSYDTLLAITKG